MKFIDQQEWRGAGGCATTPRFCLGSRWFSERATVIEGLGGLDATCIEANWLDPRQTCHRVVEQSWLYPEAKADEVLVVFWTEKPPGG